MSEIKERVRLSRFTGEIVTDNYPNGKNYVSEKLFDAVAAARDEWHRLYETEHEINVALRRQIKKLTTKNIALEEQAAEMKNTMKAMSEHIRRLEELYCPRVEDMDMMKKIPES